MGSIFSFKQFDLQQELSSQKLTTDSCILGAYAPFKNEKANVLDIGCGTGILSLMIAQRFPKLQIDSIDIDLPSCKEANINFENAPFNNLNGAQNISLEHYIANKKYKFIICNPPYFNNSLKSKKNQRAIARHTTQLSFNELIQFVEKNLEEEGIFTLILPKTEISSFDKEIEKSSLKLIEQLQIRNSPKKDYSLIVQSYSKLNQEINKSSLTVRTTENEYTDEYKSLLKEFFIIF